MSKNLFNLPPVIRVFLSSTFADMDKERSYFNEVLAPKISRICSERGVSFFSVDLRWGITEEEQINGQVLPICLSEIDKCRPYFIGMIGNRYGSVLETVPINISQYIPWLQGKEGSSITEIEMLYAVLDHSINNSVNNSAFYIRTERLSKELYNNLKLEDSIAITRLNKLKKRITQDNNILSNNYDTLEEFGELVMRDILNWLNTNFPKNEDVMDIRKKWYNSEILRNYIRDNDITNFINSYLNESKKPLLIYGDGARGKTTFFTAWKPLEGYKILINCGADDSYSYWPIIAKHIINEIREYDDMIKLPDIPLGASMTFKIMDFAYKTDDSKKERLNSDFYFVTDLELEKFRISFLDWIKNLSLKDKFTIIINDLNLLDDAKSKLLSWLPSVLPDKLRIICTTNDDDMVKTAGILGWNVKEHQLFNYEGAKQLINAYLHSYGKNLSSNQFDKLMSSDIIKFPGQLLFIVKFLIKYGKFDNIDYLISDISKIHQIQDIYKYVYDYLICEYSITEIKTIHIVLGLVRFSNISLSEQECFQLSQKVNYCTAIEWSHTCNLFEQFNIIKGDYWNIRDEELQKFVDTLLVEEEYQLVNLLLGDYFFEQLKKDNNSELQNIRYKTAYAKECLLNYQNSKNWEKLLYALSNDQLLYYLSKLDWYYIKASWIKLFLYSDYDISNYLLNLIKQYRNKENNDKFIAIKLAALLLDIGFNNCKNDIYEIFGENQEVYSDESINLSEMLSEKFISLYNKMYKMQIARDFRNLLKYSSDLLENKYSFKDVELCQILFFKANAEQQLHLIDECIKTTNDYYLVSIKAGLPDEMLRALSMRGNILFINKQYYDTMIINKKIANISLNLGNLREYLSAINMVAMCQYHLKNYKESINIFDELILYWEKLSNLYEAARMNMNRCNALYYSGNVQDALINSENLYYKIKDDLQLKIICTSLLGNMGLYALELQLYDKSENYLLTTIKYSKELGKESALLNAYSLLIELYKTTDNFIKIIELSKEKMQFLWERKDYSSLINTLKNIISILLQYKYISQANKLENQWKEKFSKIPNGKKYFEQQINTHTIDEVEVDKLKEAAIIAKSDSDFKQEAKLYYKIAQILQLTNINETIEYLLAAAILYRKIGENDQYNICVEQSIILQFDQGLVKNEKLCEKVLKYANDEIINEIINTWKQIGNYIDNQNDLLKRKNILLHNIRISNIYNLLCGILTYICQFKNLIVNCLIDVSYQIVYLCTAEELIEIVNKIPQDCKEIVIYHFGLVMQEDFEKDLAILTKDYLSPEANRIIEFYEKCIIFFKRFNNIKMAEMSGNLAIIFRRRKDKEKTLYYHSLSIEVYEKENKKQDYLIEMMNIATAYYEFNEYEKSISILKKGLYEATDYKEDKLAAFIAGNLASMLIKTKDKENHDEIINCFIIEEKYFRSVGNLRDLVISLLNQIIYLSDTASQNSWQSKLDEASNIIKENNFTEFMSVLSKLEWKASKNQNSSNNNNLFLIRKKIEFLLATSGKYVLADTRLEEGYYHFICSSKEEKNMGEEQLHILYNKNSHCEIQLFCLYQPAMFQNSAVTMVQDYINWWNKIGDYQLIFNESEHILQANTILLSSNWDDLTNRFNLFMRFWKVDKINILALLIGLMELSVCQGKKLQVVNQDDD